MMKKVCHLKKKFELAVGFKSKPTSFELSSQNRDLENYGLNVVLWVELCGPVDPVTGVVVELAAFKSIMNEQVVSKFDHQYFDSETELTIIKKLYDTINIFLQKHFPFVTLDRLKWESPWGVTLEIDHQKKLTVTSSSNLLDISYRLNNDKLTAALIANDHAAISENADQESLETATQNGMFQIDFKHEKKRYDDSDEFIYNQAQFCGTHYLTVNSYSEIENHNLFGKCMQLHGHHFIIQLTYNKNRIEESAFSHLIDKLQHKFDGKLINHIDICKDNVVTCENMLFCIKDYIRQSGFQIPDTIRLIETFNNHFELKP